MLLSGSESRRTVSGYGFAGVIVDTNRARLLVDGIEVAASALPLKLLRAVCEADGKLLSRQVLFEQIWPRQVISDEALTKLIGRTREALGPYGEMLVTVRGQGVRLDTKVEPLFELPSPEPVASSVNGSLPAANEDVNPPARFRKVGVVACIGAAVAIAALALWGPQADAVISTGYGLRASDLQASRRETAGLVSAAFKAELNGELVHARTMMRSAHESDQTSPVPALMLAWWDANASPDSAQQWIAAARARLRADSPAYLRLMVEYFDARGRGGEVRGPINALLDLRPQAWELQFARAHDQMGNREFPGALRSLQQIPLDIDAERVADVLADRVSLGDAAAISLPMPAIKNDPMLDACLQGRFAYSRAVLAEAIAAFDRCREAAQVRRDYIHARDAAMFAALAALEAGAADAAQRVDGAARLCHEQNVQTCEVEMLGLRAFIEARAGHTELGSATLADAWQHNARDWAQPPLLLVALENGLMAPADPVAVAQGVPRDAVFGGVADIVLAWQDFARGDKQSARQRLGQAREHGIAQTYHAEDAALLDARLGGPVTACRVDPPYPNVMRLGACVSLQALR